MDELYGLGLLYLNSIIINSNHWIIRLVIFWPARALNNQFFGPKSVALSLGHNRAPLHETIYIVFKGFASSANCKISCALSPRERCDLTQNQPVVSCLCGNKDRFALQFLWDVIGFPIYSNFNAAIYKCFKIIKLEHLSPATPGPILPGI